MTDTFNTEEFTSHTTGGFSTDYVLIPEGEYNSVIEKVDERHIDWEKNGRSGTMHLFEVLHKLDLDSHSEGTARELMGDDVGFARQSVRLDYTESGELSHAPGKNVPLGRLLVAVNQNDPSLQWEPAMLVGQALKVQVKHKKERAEVANVARL